jgi:hypothetical protein
MEQSIEPKKKVPVYDKCKFDPVIEMILEEQQKKKKTNKSKDKKSSKEEKKEGYIEENCYFMKHPD